MNHVKAMLDATHIALGVTPRADNDATPDCQPSQPNTMQGFTSKPPAPAPKVKRVKGATRDAVAKLAQAPW